MSGRSTRRLLVISSRSLLAPFPRKISPGRSITPSHSLNATSAQLTSTTQLAQRTQGHRRGNDHDECLPSPGSPAAAATTASGGPAAAAAGCWSSSVASPDREQRANPPDQHGSAARGPTAGPHGSAAAHGPAATGRQHGHHPRATVHRGTVRAPQCSGGGPSGPASCEAQALPWSADHD